MKILICTGTRGNDVYFGTVQFMAEQVRRHNVQIAFGECSWSAPRAQGLAIREIYIQNPDWVLFVDADVAPPMDTLDKLLACNLDIVCAPVWMAYESDVHVNVHLINNPSRLYTPKRTGIDEVGHASFACLLVSRKVFDAFKAHNETLLEWSPMVSKHPEGGVPDAFFSYKARQMGFKIHVCWDVTGAIHHRPMRLGDELIQHIKDKVSL